MTRYLYVNRDGSEIISDLSTNVKCGEEEIINEDGTKSTVHYWFRNGELSSGATINGYGKLYPESSEDVSNAISSISVGKISDRDPNDIYYFEDVSDKFPPSYDKLDKWDKSGKLKALRTEGGHRRYRQSDIYAIVGIGEEIKSPEDDSKEIIVATYARCSTPDQKSHGDIDRQSARIFEYCTKKGYKIEHIIKDMGSGLNDKRKGFVKLCKLVIDGKIDKVVIEHKDRLTRFQYNLIEMFFNSYGVEIELLDKTEYTEQQELVNDMMMLITSFSGKVYSLRAKENAKKRKEIKNKNQ